jgi:PAS domain S-box-containing protein
MTSGDDDSSNIDALAAARASETGFRALFEQAAVGVAQIDSATGRFLRVNRKYTEIIGYSAEEMCSTDFMSISHEAELGEDLEQMARLHRGEIREFQMEKRLVRKDGKVIWIALLVSAMWEPGAQLTHHIAVVQDIDQRRRAEEELRETEALLSESQRVAKIGSWSYDFTTRRSRWSDETYRLYGVAKGRAIFADTLFEVLHPDDHAALRAWRDAWRSHRPSPIVCRVLLPDGNLRLLRADADLLHAPDGTPLRMVGTVQDVSEQHLINAAMRLLSTGVARLSGRELHDELAHRLGTLLDVDIALVLRAQKNNPTILSSVGAWVDGSRALPLDLVIAQTPLVDVLREGTTFVRDISARYPNAHALLALGARAFAGVALVDGEGRSLGAILVARRRAVELSESAQAVLPLFAVRAAVELERERAEEERRALEAQLRHAQKMEAIGTLAGGIAHDFNNLLMSILANTSYLRDELAEAGPSAHVLESVNSIASATDRATSLVRQILAFSRKQAANRAVIDLGTVVAEAAKLLRAAMPAAIALRVETNPSPLIYGDTSQLHQVVMNLGTNAWRAILSRRDRSSGEVVMSVDTVVVGALSAARLSVRDDGTGMTADTRERVFEPYFTTREPGEGLGLGLAVVHGIVAEHGGSIAVESELGEGSTFRVVLPATTHARPTPSTTPRKESLPPQRGRRVLYVDDETALVSIAVRTLTKLGFRAKGVSAPQDALELLINEPFDVLITDQNMPGMSGVELASKVGTRSPTLPIILVSGRLDASSEAIPNRLAKPYSTAQLVELIDALCPPR